MLKSFVSTSDFVDRYPSKGKAKTIHETHEPNN